MMNNQDNNYHQSDSDKAYVRKRFITRSLIAGVLVAILIILTAFSYKQMPEQSTSPSANLPTDDRPDGSSNPSGYMEQDSSSRGLSGKNFILGDGSIDTAQIDNIKQKISGTSILTKFMTQLDKEVAEGIITAEQGKAIKQAFGVE